MLFLCLQVIPGHFAAFRFRCFGNQYNRIKEEGADSGVQSRLPGDQIEKWGGHSFYTKQDLLVKGFYFILYRRRYFLLFSELIQYACQRRPEIRLRPQDTRVYKYTKIQGPRFQRNYVIARDLKSDLHDTSFQSSPHCSSQDPFAYNESLQNPTSSLLIKILFFRPLSSVHLFQSNRRFQAIEFVDLHVSEKLI